MPTDPAGVLLLTYWLDLGGSERQMVEVAKALDRRYFEPHVGCFNTSGIRGEELRAAGLPILHMPVTSFASVSALRGAWQMIRYIRQHNIRLVHSFDVPLNLFSVPVARAARTIVLSSQRAHRTLTPGAKHKLLRVTDKLTNGIVVNCEYMRRHLIDEEGVPDQLIHLCYNGVDLAEFHPASEERPAELRDAETVIGVVCGLRKEKGLSTLVDAFARVAPQHPSVKLCLVGEGVMLDDLENQARALGVRDRVVFAGKRKDIPRWLHAMDIFVLPSLSEALSNSLMEAMSCGCCGVASRVGGNPELIADGERGLLFEKGDAPGLAQALSRLLENPELRAKLAAAGTKFIHEGFTVAHSVARMQQIYKSFLL
jgi:glycosyltransferase involved in cell wall biosynthesis